MRTAARPGPLLVALPLVTAAAAAPAAEPAQPAAVGSGFTDVAAASGLDFVHFIGATGEFHFPEIMGSGCALLDYDGDGDLDAYLLQGGMIDPAKTPGDSIFPPRVPLPPRNRLFRNELIPTGALRFTDVTETSGAGDDGYAMGVATGDYDNDGDVDVFVTNFGPDVLLRNEGDGTFRDVTAAAGLGDPRWTTSAAFFDYDGDGLLDLATVAYVDFTLATSKACHAASGRRDYCSPQAFPPLPDRLYRNLGDGTFRDVSAATGIERAYGHGLGVAPADFDGDGRTDFYVANDGDANQLWLNEGARFTDAGLLSGAAYNHAGMPEAGMGVAVGDPDCDGDADLFLTHLAHETNTFYENLGNAVFEDRTTGVRLGLASRPRTGFGVVWADVDHDAILDLFVVNGAVGVRTALAGDPYPYHEPDQLFLGRADGTFTDASREAGLHRSEVGRGLAVGDVDNDGDLDVLVSNNNGPARLLRNDLAGPSGWAIVRVVDAAAGRDAIGATARLELSDGRVLTRWVTTAGSYCSARDPRVHFAWPPQLEPRALRITTADGRTRVVDGIPPGAVTTVRVGAAPEEDAP